MVAAGGVALAETGRRALAPRLPLRGHPGDTGSPQQRIASPTLASPKAGRGAHDEEQSARGVARTLARVARGTGSDVAGGLAAAFLSGVWNERALLRRGAAALDRRPRWLLPVVRAVLAGYHRPPADRPRELAAFIALSVDGASRDDPPVRVRRWFIPEPAMGRMRWPVPELASLGDLARMLSLAAGDLAWLADTRGLERTAPDERLRNYSYTWLPRGGRPPRGIERPKRRLKEAQRQVLHEIVDRISAHPRRTGSCAGARPSATQPPTPAAAWSCGWISRTSSRPSRPGGSTGSSAAPATRRPSPTRSPG
jgi:hypothetical protein